MTATAAPRTAAQTADDDVTLDAAALTPQLLGRWGHLRAFTREILKASPDLDREMCAALIRGCFESEDYTEGRTAFMQKRKPVFKGR